MAQFLGIFGFLSVLLRGLSLAFEALTLGGIIFVLVMRRMLAGADTIARDLRWLRLGSILLAITQICVAGTNSAILVYSTGLRLSDLTGAGFLIASALVIAGATGVACFATTGWRSVVFPLASVLILTGSVMTSHSMARLEHRGFLLAATALHHAAGAAWIGGLPYLLVTLRRTSDGIAASAVTARFSRLAVTSVAVLLGAGVAMVSLYVGSPAAAFGTSYGVMVAAKVIFTAILLTLGSLNLKIVRAIRRGDRPEMLPLRRFAEAEVGIGFTVLLAAASLTSTPPAIDVSIDRVSGQEIAQRLKPRWPRMRTPAFSELSPATPLAVPENSTLPGSFVPGQQRRTNNPADIAWSEYNHHWAGLVVFASGVLALLSCAFSWARHWPFAFLGLGAFLLVRADSENWPLGPRGFWESFQVAEVAQHRVFVLLIVAFAVFEWAVQTRRVEPRKAGLVFPLVCAIGGALLMTHSHSLGNVKEEFLAELSHIPLAILAVTAGWCRWLEIRLPDGRMRIVGRIWPACLTLIGIVLILYRES